MSEKSDFELGQLAFATDKHHDDCPFKLPHRRAAWQRGYRDATYENPTNTPPINTESTHGHILNLRQLLKKGKLCLNDTRASPLFD